MKQIVVRASFIFLAIYILTLPLSSFGASHRAVISNNPLFQGANSIFIADYGDIWLAAGFLAHTLCAYLQLKTSKFNLLANRILKYLLHSTFSVLFNVWFFGPSIVERLNVATGGHCTKSGPSAQSMSECRRNPTSSWVDGFDISGHYYFVVTSSLLLMDAIMRTETHKSVTVQESALNYSAQDHSILRQRAQKASKVVSICAVVLMTIWVMEFCVTSVFFHTAWEKALGLLGVPIILVILMVSDEICTVRSNVGPDIMV
ncbi:hypothetical protein OXX69_010676 [Metschnikowia pulcherrima]